MQHDKCCMINELWSKGGRGEGAGERGREKGEGQLIVHHFHKKKIKKRLVLIISHSLIGIALRVPLPERAICLLLQLYPQATLGLHRQLQLLLSRLRELKLKVPKEYREH